MTVRQQRHASAKTSEVYDQATAGVMDSPVHPVRYRQSGMRKSKLSTAARLLGGLSVVLVFVTGGAAGAMATTPSPMGGIVHVFAEGTGVADNAPQPVIFTGAIADFGIDHQGARDNGNADLITLTKGTFWLLAEDQSSLKSSFDPATCYATAGGNIPVVLSHGTGAYVGIKATLKATVRIRFVFPRLANGKCNEGNSAVPLVSLFSAQASGTVTFG
jgi:hypothetical protein